MVGKEPGPSDVNLDVEVAPSLRGVEPFVWNALVPEGEPFLEHGFLTALEESGSVGASSGWTPFYVLVRQGSHLVGAAAAYLKTHSFGEFVFDWAWADAFHRVGGRYYPKLVVAAPFTPATGSRLLVAPGAEVGRVREALLRGIVRLQAATRASSIHVLFAPQEEVDFLCNRGFLPRYGFQFHWQNKGYTCFDDYLSAMTHKRRSEVRRERRQVQQHGAEVVEVLGREATVSDWKAMEEFYRNQSDRMGGSPYLTPRFFQILREREADRAILFLARQQGETVAGTLNFRKGSHLYGRYWGSRVEVPCLHFETCYYRAVEYAITHQLTRFEAGAQGEHKLARGFLPELTHSAHFLGHPALREAIDGFLRRERDHIIGIVAEYRSHSPFRQEP